MVLTTSPNILFVFSDQQHWKASGYQDPFFDTPIQDTIAKEGVIFENAFCTTPQCSPSRSSILTGLYPHKTGVVGNIGNAGGHNLKIPTIGYLLKMEGYSTAYFGKWHLGNSKTSKIGWDYFLINDKEKSGDKNTTRNVLRYLKKVNKIKKSNSRKPFALFISYINPHDITKFNPNKIKITKNELINRIKLPNSWNYKNFSWELLPPCQKQFLEEDKGSIMINQPINNWKKYRAFYRENVKLFDNELGKVINYIKKIGEYDNTIIIITSDHGDMDCNHGLIMKGPFMYENLIRVPLIIRIPKKYGGKSNKTINHINTINVDLVPTILDISKLKPINQKEEKINSGIFIEKILELNNELSKKHLYLYPEENLQKHLGIKHFDGYSLINYLVSNKLGDLNSLIMKRKHIIIEYYSKQKWINPIRTIRTNYFKYSVYLNQGEELYDIKEDPEEFNNLINNKEYSNILKVLKEKLEQWIINNNDPFFSLKRTDRKGNPI